jgi:hypothetical protein
MPNNNQWHDGRLVLECHGKRACSADDQMVHANARSSFPLDVLVDLWLS